MVEYINSPANQISKNFSQMCERPSGGTPMVKNSILAFFLVLSFLVLFTDAGMSMAESIIGGGLTHLFTFADGLR